MAKEKKRVSAPKTKQQEEKTPVNVVQMGNVMDQIKTGGNNTSLSPDGIVQALTGLKEMIHDNPNAAEYYNITDDAVKKLNAFTAMGFATVLAVEVEAKKSKFAITMLAHNKDIINALAEFTGVSIDQKLLGAPNEKGEIEVPSDAIKVAPEKKKQIKKEIALAKNAELVDVTKIKNDEELKKSLTVLLSKTNDSLYDRMYNAIKFYRAFLELSASKSDNKEAELKAVREISDEELLERISKIVETCSFSNSGPAKYMFAVTGTEKCIIPAFCMLRRACKDRKTGMVKVDDITVAAIVRILILWVGRTRLREIETLIASCEKNIALLKKNEKANKGGINSETAKIEKFKTDMEYIKSVMDLVMTPPTDYIQAIPEDYHKVAADGHKLAARVYKDIVETYMPDVKEDKVDTETLDNNVVQYAGIITNLFKDPLTRSTEYSEAFLEELKEKEEETESKK